MSIATGTSAVDQRSVGRLNLVFVLLMMAPAGLAVHLAMMLRHSQPAAAEQVLQQQRMVVPIPARPGSIWGRNRTSYRLLASSKQSPGCFLDPAIIPDDELIGVVDQLAACLSLPRDELRQSVLDRRQKRFVWIKHDLSDAEAQAIGEMDRLAVGIRYEWRREYPSDALAATVLGFRLRDGEPGGGLELSQQEWLAAVDGQEVMLADARRRPIRLADDGTVAPQDGQNVYLTLDVAVQSYLAEALTEAVEKFGAKWGTGVVVEPMTGRVLAMCSAPSFDPGAYGDSPAEYRTNRAVSVPFEPGSVAKPLFAAAAVDAGLLTYDTLIDCENGAYHASRGGRITDHGNSYGEISLTDVVVRSSNIGMAKVGEMMGNDRLHETATRFGLGARSGIELPGESGGIVRPLDVWDGYSLRRVPFGQEMSVTALQLAMAFSAVANGGLLMEPHLVDHVRDASNEIVFRQEPRVVRRVLTPQTAAATLAVMAEVVERGTGKACQLDGWSSFGKTGTAQIPGRGGYVDGAYTGSFIGGGPVGSPRVICLISIYWPERSKGYYGSTVAAPYVRRVLQRTLAYLEVPLDQPGTLAGLP